MKPLHLQRPDPTSIPRRARSPITSTGEIMITGSIDLPRSLGATGPHPNLFDFVGDGPDARPARRGRHHNDVAPAGASRAVSTHTSSRGVMTPPRKRGARLPTVLAITAAVLAIGVPVALRRRLRLQHLLMPHAFSPTFSAFTNSGIQSMTASAHALELLKVAAAAADSKAGGGPRCHRRLQPVAVGRHLPHRHRTLRTQRRRHRRRNRRRSSSKPATSRCAAKDAPRAAGCSWTSATSSFTSSTRKSGSTTPSSACGRTARS